MKKITVSNYRITSAKNRSRLCVLLLCAVLSCAACACGTAPGKDGTAGSAPSQEAATDGDESLPNPDPVTEAGQDPSAEQPDNDDASASDMPDDTSDTGSPETDTTVSVFESKIGIEMKEETNELTADDGTVYYTESWLYPIVTIEGNEDAAERINADLKTRVEASKASTETADWAKEYYELYLSEDSEYPFSPYVESMDFQTQRADSNVISFTITYYSFAGGAHGNYGSVGVNYNAKTGEVISFADLSEDPDAFHEDTLAYNQNLAKTPSYQERMFSDDILEMDGSTLESVLYAENAWYLSASGLVFISDPYALGPYASGTINFTIPYRDLAGMGLKNNYSYTNRLTLMLQRDETTAFDLNGDAQDDTIYFGTETTQDEDGNYNSTLHLIINDIDFSRKGSETVQKELAEEPWGDFSLFDLNVEDDYVELVMVSMHSGEKPEDPLVYYSHFFRYTKEGELLYLGKADGNALDPTLTITALEK